MRRPEEPRLCSVRPPPFIRSVSSLQPERYCENFIGLRRRRPRRYRFTLDGQDHARRKKRIFSFVLRFLYPPDFFQLFPFFFLKNRNSRRSVFPNSRIIPREELSEDGNYPSRNDAMKIKLGISGREHPPFSSSVYRER